MRITGDQRDWLFFTGWLLTGSGYLLALLTVLSIGVFILPIPLIATVALATRRGALRCLPGLISSASLPLFLLTYLNREGPGTHCTASAGGGSCTEGLLDPWILLAVGLLVLAAGVALFLRIRRRPAVTGVPSHSP
ncbi:hypothetical protein AB0M86_20020 [Streptomyces sp. NPDC051639]|uniref:hypothetical protein n=1 Tax=unclassified Streptomyces TaxID=2593676 RepID=UPI00143EDED5|nr:MULTISPECIES: hypothetical protein [unclassified Streptomyces]QIY60943.1 hypothetical protein HEP85_03580 [Streptomyces sp. RPA4-2]